MTERVRSSLPAARHVHPVVPARRLGVLVALALSLAACDGGAVDDRAGSGGSESVDLEGKSFVSTDVVGHELASGTEVTLIFQEGRISATAGCNTLLGGATWDGGALVVAEPMARTMMACDDVLMQQDEWLEAFLRSAPQMTVDAGALTLGDEAQGITLSEQ